MSISSTLSTALSGLTAASRAAEIASSNVANALTEGYARRELELGARVTGGSGQGVSVRGIARVVDRALLNDRRLADGSAAERDLRAGFLKALETALGAPDNAASLSAQVAALDTALLGATSRPDSEARLDAVLQAAQAIAAQIGSTAAMVQDARASADDRIAEEVALVNTTLARVAELNSTIRTSLGSGRDASALLDQRQQLVDAVARVVPLREVARDDGQVALYTTSGLTLLDGRPAELGFTPVGVITPDMTLATGALSGLTLNGRDFTAKGGTLAGHFALRDDLAPAAQTRLDAVARDLVERFADPAVDPTLAPGDAGLFTDAGGAFLAANETGLAQRLAVHPAADPAQGGALWRLRDGLAALVPGPTGDGALPGRLQGALAAARQPVSGGFLPAARSAAGLVVDLTSGAASARLAAESAASFANARASALKVQELQNGVDTDQEMQQLLIVEQAYAANAKVVQTVDEMLKILLGI